MGLAVAGAFTALVPLTVFLLVDPGVFTDSPLGGSVLSATVMVFFATLAGSILFAVVVPARLQRRGLSGSEAGRFALEAPLSRSSFWSRPTIAALLVDAPQPRPPRAGSDQSAPTISSAATRTTADPPPDVPPPHD